MPSLGSLASDGRTYISLIPEQSAYLLFFRLSHLLNRLCLNLIGDGLRDAFDPRLTEVTLWQKKNHLLVVKDLCTSFDIPAGEVRSVAGISFSLEKARSSESWGNPARANP
jgi:hypothetical protein